jgi:hypothetical protein
VLLAVGFNFCALIRERPSCFQERYRHHALQARLRQPASSNRAERASSNNLIQRIRRHPLNFTARLIGVSVDSKLPMSWPSASYLLFAIPDCNQFHTFMMKYKNSHENMAHWSPAQLNMQQYLFIH